MSEKRDFELKLVQKEETPRAITTTIGTASSASRTNFFINLSSITPSVTQAQPLQLASEPVQAKK